MVAALAGIAAPNVAALPTASANTGKVFRLTTDGRLYASDGTVWRKLDVFGAASGATVRETAAAGIAIPGTVLVDYVLGSDIEIGPRAAYEAHRMPMGSSDLVLGPAPFEAATYAKAFSTVNPNAGNVIGTVGFPLTKTGTWVSGSAPATTNTKTKALRQNIPTAATAGSSVGMHSALNGIRISDGAGNGGFYFRCVFAFSAWATGSRFFCGLRSSTSLISNVEPTTLTNFFGFGANSTDTNIKIYCAGGTAQPSVDTGFAISTTELYQVTIASLRDESNTVYASISKYSDGTESETILTANLPAATTYLGPTLWINNGVAAVVQSLDFVKLHAEWRLTG